jgi:flagellar M-ring protein FliF
MQALIQGLRALGPVRLAAMGVVGAAVLGLLAMLAVTAGRQPMAPLYGGLDLNDAAQAAEQLGRQHIPFQLGAGGTAILVPADLVPHARVALAKAGLPSGGSVGYELFDRAAAGLTSTDFEQQIAQTRALEGELARSIRAIAGVRGARVHLVLPRREPFAREQQDARASVLLTMAGATRLDREGVQAVLNLVAAVPGLKPRDIAIVDSRGELLARAGTPVDAVAGGALSGEELRRATELRLARAAEEMLERSLGPSHVRAEAAVRMDYDQVRETQARYDPDGQVPRSEQSVTTASKNTEPARGRPARHGAEPPARVHAAPPRRLRGQRRARGAADQRRARGAADQRRYPRPSACGGGAHPPEHPGARPDRDPSARAHSDGRDDLTPKREQNGDRSVCRA